MQAAATVMSVMHAPTAAAMARALQPMPLQDAATRAARLHSTHAQSQQTP